MINISQFDDHIIISGTTSGHMLEIYDNEIGLHVYSTGRLDNKTTTKGENYDYHYVADRVGYCPRCKTKHLNPMDKFTSRIDDLTLICEDCSIEEKLFDIGIAEKKDAEEAWLKVGGE